MTETIAGDAVTLVLPALPQYGRVARLTMANLALRNGFGYHEIEDLQLAIDEAFILLLGYEGRSGHIATTFQLGETMRVVCTAELTDVAPPDEGARQRFEMLVSDLVDHQFVSESGLEVELTKGREATEQVAP